MDRDHTAPVRTAFNFFSAKRNRRAQSPLRLPAAPQSREPITAFPSEHLTPFFVNTDIAQALLSINGAASHIPQRGL
jgi:hypothetical protein